MNAPYMKFIAKPCDKMKGTIIKRIIFIHGVSKLMRQFHWPRARR